MRRSSQIAVKHLVQNDHLNSRATAQNQPTKLSSGSLSLITSAFDCGHVLDAKQPGY